MDTIFAIAFAACIVAMFFVSHRQWKREVRDLERRIDILATRINRGNLPPYD